MLVSTLSSFCYCLVSVGFNTVKG